MQVETLGSKWWTVHVCSFQRLSFTGRSTCTTPLYVHGVTINWSGRLRLFNPRLILQLFNLGLPTVITPLYELEY